jgi:hypothetical protein
MAREQPGSKPAKMVYRPVGFAASMAAGIGARQIFQQVWKRATPGEGSEAPKAMNSGARLREVLIAAAIEGAIYAAVRAVIDRGGARAFQRWSGEWPGD